MSSNVQNTNLLHTNEFLLTIDKFPHVSFFSQQVEIPSVSMGVTERPTPIMPIYSPSNRLTFDPLTITFKVDEDMRNWAELFGWLFIAGKLAEDEDHDAMVARLGGYASDITLTMLTNKGNPMGKITFVNAFPENLSGPALSTIESQTTYGDSTVTFRYTYFKYESITA